MFWSPSWTLLPPSHLTPVVDSEEPALSPLPHSYTLLSQPHPSPFLSSSPRFPFSSNPSSISQIPSNLLACPTTHTPPRPASPPHLQHLSLQHGCSSSSRPAHPLPTFSNVSSHFPPPHIPSFPTPGARKFSFALPLTANTATCPFLCSPLKPCSPFYHLPPRLPLPLTPQHNQSFPPSSCSLLYNPPFLILLLSPSPPTSVTAACPAAFQ